MEHLPMPKGAELSENDVVPYASSTDYVGVPFLSYPQKKGFHHLMPRPDSLDFGSYESSHPTPDDKLASFMQTWLFFGMLQEVLGSLYQHRDFVRSCESNEGPIQVLTTAKLPFLLKERFPAIPAIDNDHSSLIAHLHACMDVASEASDVVQSRLSRKVSFSILATIETLCSTFNASLTTNFEFSLAWITSLPKNYWIEQMCLNGWCAREATIASESLYSAQALHYLSKIKKSYMDDSHCNCTQEECRGVQIDLTKYEPRHCDRRCDCAIISVDNDRLNSILVRILGSLSFYCKQFQDSQVDVLLNPSLQALTALESGKFPLVSLEVEESTAELKIELVESSGDTCYVALSHVWANGLGNPFGNALPKCQLLGLQTLAQEVVRAGETDGPALLWLDTLCVPCKHGAGKTVAMAMMRKTYKEAHHVLVLESSLRCWDTKSSDLIEAAVRIFTSLWLRRLWCLQEGALAKRLWFQFQDRPVELAEIFGELRAEYQSRNFSQKEIVFNIMLVYQSLRIYVEESPNLSRTPQITLDKIILALRYRGVSVASDEPICLVNLFDLDANFLTGQDGGAMSRFWRALCETQRVPRSIVFFQGPRLHDEGFRWAPATLLGAERLPLIPPDYLEPATFSQKGLMVRFPGVVISRPVFDIIPLAFNQRNGLPDLWHLFEHRKDKWYGFVIKSAEVQTCIFGEEDATQASMLNQGNAFAIIFSHDPNVQQRKPLKEPHAMFVSIKAHEDGVYHGHIQGEVNLITRNSGECLILNRAQEISQRLPRNELVKVLFQVKDMEDSKKSETVTPIVEALLARATKAAEEALQEPAFKSIHDANLRTSQFTGTAQFVHTIWSLYSTRVTLVNRWLPDDSVWCLD